MGKLDNKIAYLSGAIENANNHGVSWRTEIVQKVHDAGINLGFIDPCDKGDSYLGEIGKERAKLVEAKANKDYETVTTQMKEVRHWDLRAVDEAQVVILGLDPEIPTCGTWDEVFQAERRQIHILAIIKGGPSKAPDWLFAVMNYKFMFSTVDECVEYLKMADSGEIEIDSKWLSLDDSVKRRKVEIK